MSSEFERGTLVWAKMPSYPWWPAMVDNDPDYCAYIYPKTAVDVATSLHVVFLDKEVSRRWIRLNCILPFRGTSFDSLAPFLGRHGKNYTKKVKVAYDRAMAAIKLPVEERLRLYGFVPRFKDDKYESSTSETNVRVHLDQGLRKRKKRSKKAAKSGMQKPIAKGHEDKGSSTEEEDVDLYIKFHSFVAEIS